MGPELRVRPGQQGCGQTGLSPQAPVRTRTASCGAGGACVCVCAAALGETSVRVREKDASLTHLDTRLRFSLFLVFHAVSGPLQFVNGSQWVPPEITAGWLPPPTPAQSEGDISNVAGSPGITASHPGFLISGGCQLPLPIWPPVLYWDLG